MKKLKSVTRAGAKMAQAITFIGGVALACICFLGGLATLERTIHGAGAQTPLVSNGTYFSPQRITGGASFGTAGAVPLAITNTTITNFDWRIDCTGGKDVNLQFTGALSAGSSTASIQVAVYGANTTALGLTNENFLFNWNFSLTNATQFTYTTNLTSANGVGALQYLHVYSVSNTPVTGTAAVTNWFMVAAVK